MAVMLWQWNRDEKLESNKTTTTDIFQEGEDLDTIQVV